MGLDLVELIMNVEDTFAISIPDDEASRIETAGQLHDCIMQHLDIEKQPGPCLTAAAFHQIRRGLITVFRIDRRTIRPLLPLLQIATEHQWRTAWPRLEAALALDLPNLPPPHWRERTKLVIASTPILGFGLLLAGRWLNLPNPFRITEIVLLVGGILISLFLPPTSYPVYLQIARETVGQLAELVAAMNPHKLRNDLARWSADSAWLVLRKLIAQQANVPLHHVTTRSHLINDLHLG